MKGPQLFTTYSDVERIKNQIQEYDWCASSYKNIKDQVDEMLNRGFSVPREKGFVFYTHCPRDGERLTFDPYGEDNICPRCGMRYKDENYRRARICTYHHWLSQMAVLAGIVYLISEESCYAQVVRSILLDYVKYYPEYPNNDNELGTTKTFQSTYMESVWITYLAGAYDMVKEDISFSQMDKLRIINDFFRVSAGVILDYDEKENNRQAFNNCALCAIALLSQDQKLLEYALEGPHGFRFHMSKSVLEDGMWYEGDNYHFATVPSLVNMAEMCLNCGIDLYGEVFEGHSIKDLFLAPLVSLQPDLTFPSRKDSPYKTYISQRWYSGLYEVAYRRYQDPVFGEILKKMYEMSPEPGESLHNAAGVMDIFPADIACRGALDWRGFLNAVPELKGTEQVPQAAHTVMEGTGLSIIRQKEDTYCSLDYGHYGGEHGHPDRLQLTYFNKGRRWLTDYGTGQYYFDHLNWYRSTLGHNTVCIDEKNHEKVEGKEVLFGQTSDFTILEAVVPRVAPGVDMKRTLLLFKEGMLLDLVQMESSAEHQYDYVLHSLGTIEVNQKTECISIISQEGAYRFLENIRCYHSRGEIEAVFQKEEAGLHIKMLPVEGGDIYTAYSYGSPYRLKERFPMLGVRQRASSCVFVTLMEDVEKQEHRVSDVWLTEKGEYAVSVEGKLFFMVACRNGWKIRTVEGEREENFLFENFSDTKKEKKKRTVEKKDISVQVPEFKDYKELYASAWHPNLILDSEFQIIRSETRWGGKEDLSAEGRISVIAQELVLEMKVKDKTACFMGGKYDWDNDSIQIYFRRKSGREYGYLAMPLTEDGCAKIRSIGNSGSENAIGISAELGKHGYSVLVSIPFTEIGGMPVAGEQIEFDVVVNDRDQGVRRDKQMIWSGTREEIRTYLKGTDHPDGFYGRLEIIESNTFSKMFCV